MFKDDTFIKRKSLAEMKEITLFLITVYQKFISPGLKMVFGFGSFCRFNPSCSEYAKVSIAKDGLIKGGKKAVLRILSCRP